MAVEDDLDANYHRAAMPHPNRTIAAHRGLVPVTVLAAAKV